MCVRSLNPNARVRNSIAAAPSSYESIGTTGCMLGLSPRTRGRAESSRWLLVRGRGDKPLPAEIGPKRLQRHGASRRPSVARGDLAICYASVWQAVFAVVEVASEPEHDPSLQRWAWS